MLPQKTLYDALEVSRLASAEAIRASFERLRRAHLERRSTAADMDPECHFQLVKDAFFVIGDPQRRRDYDRRLALQASMEEYPLEEDTTSDGFSRLLQLLTLALLLGCGLLYYQSMRSAELERADLAIEQRQAELAALERQKQLDQALAARESARQAAQEDARRRYEYEAAQRSLPPPLPASGRYADPARPSSPHAPRGAMLVSAPRGAGVANATP